MILCTPVPPPGILPMGTFTACGILWVYEGSTTPPQPALSIAQLRAGLTAGWRRYCNDVHPHNRKAARVCFRAHTKATP